MDILKKLSEIKETLTKLSLKKTETIEEVIETEEVALEAVETETIETELETVEEEENTLETEEVKFEVTEEMFLELAQTVADLILRVEALEPTTEEAPEEEIVEEELSEDKKVIAELKAEIAESKEPATEPIINGEDKTEVAQSFALKQISQINKRREELGLDKY